MLETTLYDRLAASVGSLLGGTGGQFDPEFSNAFDIGNEMTARIYPVTATEDTELPALIYTVTNTQSVWTLQGPTGVSEYSFGLDIVGINFETVQTIASACREALDGWHDSAVLVCSLQDAAAQPLEVGFSYHLSFNIVAGV